MEQNDNNHINDLELVMLYNKHIKYLETIDIGKKTIFDTEVNVNMIDVMRKRRDAIKTRYIGPKCDRLASHINKRISNSKTRRIAY